MTFAMKLRELRDKAGLSEAKLAAASGVTFGAIHQYGLGRRMPSFAAVVKIAHALGVSCEEFTACEGMADEPAPPVKKAAKKPAKKK